MVLGNIFLNKYIPVWDCNIHSASEWHFSLKGVVIAEAVSCKDYQKQTTMW